MGGSNPAAGESSSSKTKAVTPMVAFEAKAFVDSLASLSSLQLLSLERVQEKYPSYFLGLRLFSYVSYEWPLSFLHKLLMAYRASGSLTFLEQALLPTEQQEPLESERLWKVVADMLQAGALRKGRFGFVNDIYYAHVFIDGKFLEKEVMNTPKGMAPTYENRRSISVKEELKEACQRYVDHQAFVKKLRGSLLHWMALAEHNSHFKSYFINECYANTPEMVQESIQFLENKDWALATAAIKLIHAFEYLHKQLCPSLFLKVLHESAKVAEGSAEEIKAYNHLLMVLSDKFAQRPSIIASGWGPEVVKAISSLPECFNEAKRHLQYLEPSLFADLPSDGFTLIQYSPRVQVPLFNKMDPAQKKEALENARGKEMSLLYALTTGDFTGEYSNQQGIALRNHLEHWIDHKIDLSGLTWEDEFTAERLQDSDKPSVSKAAVLLLERGYMNNVLIIFQWLTPEQRGFLFDKIFVSLKKLALAKVDISWQLLRFLAAYDATKALELFYALKEDKTSDIMGSLLTEGPDEISLILKMNTQYSLRHEEPTGWAKIASELRASLLQMPLHQSSTFMQNQMDDLVVLFLDRIREFLSNGSIHFHVEQGVKYRYELKRELSEIFVLGLLTDSELETLGKRNHFTLRCLLDYDKVKVHQDKALYLKLLLRLAGKTIGESTLSLSVVEQEAIQQFMTILETLEPSLLLEVIRLSTADSLADALHRVLKAQKNIFTHSVIDYEALRKLLKKVASLPAHPCAALLDSNQAQEKYGHCVIAQAPQPLPSPLPDEPPVSSPPPPYPAVFMQELNFRDEQIKKLQDEIAELKNKPQDESFKDMLTHQTNTLLQAIQGVTPNTIKQLEAENNQLKCTVVKQKLLITSILYPRKDMPTQVIGRLQKSGLFPRL
jgi:hypothetical protein